MYENEAQAVLRCGQCNKPFDKQSTLKRHNYYRRSRRSGSNFIRSRSCIACAKGKSRCDNRRPACSRCLTKSVECHYPANKSETTASKLPHIDNVPTGHRDSTYEDVADFLETEDPQASAKKDHTMLNGMLAVPDLQLDSLGEDALDYLDLNLNDFLGMQTEDDALQCTLPRASAFSQRPICLIDPPMRVQQAMSAANPSIPAVPSSNVRSLAQRPKLEPGPQRIVGLILHNLRSYPLMMQRDNTLPPFIHPHLLPSNVEDIDIEPLDNCTTLVHVISRGSHASRRLFWRNVRICVIYQVMNMLVYFEPAAMCDLHSTHLVLAPLPATKMLWEAGNELAWKIKNEKDPGVHTVFGLATDGQLVKLDSAQAPCNDLLLDHMSMDGAARSRPTADWEEWCVGMDGLGGLVMLAASLTAF